MQYNNNNTNKNNNDNQNKNSNTTTTNNNNNNKKKDNIYDEKFSFLGVIFFFLRKSTKATEVWC